MCYYCHNLQNNPSAPDHRSTRCYDRANTYSQIPMEKRTYDQGQPIVRAQVLIIRTVTYSSGT
jgi:hypothetical protein